MVETNVAKTRGPQLKVIDHYGTEYLRVITDYDSTHSSVLSIPIAEIEALIKEYRARETALDRAYDCVQMLAISLNLADPCGALSPQKDADEDTAKMWSAIKDDYRKLSDAIKEIRHGHEEKGTSQAGSTCGQTTSS